MDKSWVTTYNLSLIDQETRPTGASDLKTVLCYGDSNTWGYNPQTKERFPRNVRWPGVLHQELGEDYEIIEEGLNGRTTVWDDPIQEYRSGKKYLVPCLLSHQPIDLVILFLGINDLKQRFSVPPLDIAKGVELLVQMIGKSQVGRQGTAPPVLLLAPPVVGRLTEFAEMFEGAAEKSLGLPRHYRRVADDCDCELLATSEIVVCSDRDGIHLEPAEHEKLGKAVAAKVRTILS